MRRILFLLTFFCFFTLIYFFFGCSKEKQKEFVLKENLSIGVEHGDESFMFASIANIALDSKENIYILDRKNHRVQKFDQNGNFLKSIAIRKGEGPKELTGIFGIAVTERGRIYTIDFEGTKILVLDERSEFLSSFRLDFRAINIIPYSEENVIVLGLNKDHIFHVFNEEGKNLDSFGEPFEIPANYQQYKDISYLKYPRRADRARSGKIFIVNPHKYEIRVYKSKEVNQVIKHKSEFFNPFEVLRDTRDEGRRVVGMRFPWASVFEHKDRLYVSLDVWDQDAPNQLDIFENNKYIISLKVEGFVYAIDKRGRLYFAEEEEFPKMVRCTLEH
jgi:hypothetical protein